jgi:DNA-binding winged helix-turn-helix (wHTH) protein/tetratricopeptide (TPR) repeat protein
MIGSSSSSPCSTERGIGFGNLRLEADGTLLRGNAAIHLLPKELAALRLLLAHAGQIVTPLQLKHALWGEVHVTADSVPKCVSSLRAKLSPDECIQTVYKRGYRFAAEVRPLGVSTQGTLPRLAIMPFATGFNVAEHLGPAIAEETIARLTGGQLAPVSVLARDSVFTLARRGLTAQQVGQALQANLVLTGTLRALPTHFRLRVEMIRVEDGTQIWVEDLLVAQARVAGLESELIQRLIFRLGSGGLSISAAAETADEGEGDPSRREAYEMFLRGHQEWQTLQRHRMQDGLEHLSRAAELDPSLIPAQVALVNVCVTQAFFGFMSPLVAAELVRRTAEAIPEPLRDAQSILPALGWISFHVDHDLSRAIHAFARSAHLPHDPWITRLRVMFALSRHLFPEAIDLLGAALHVDPYSPWLNARLGWAYHLSGQAAKSVEQIEQALALFPDNEGVNLYGSMILAYNGDAKRGTKLAQDLVTRSPYFDIATAIHGYALACGGQKDEARAVLERLQWLSRERFVLRSFTPAVCVALGDPEGAIAELRAAEKAHCPWFFQTLADPRLATLHGHPGFVRMQAILTRMEAAAAKSRVPKT